MLKVTPLQNLSSFKTSPFILSVSQTTPKRHPYSVDNATSYHFPHTLYIITSYSYLHLLPTNSIIFQPSRRISSALVYRQLKTRNPGGLLMPNIFFLLACIVVLASNPTGTHPAFLGWVLDLKHPDSLRLDVIWELER